MPFVAFLGVLGSREGYFLGVIWRGWATVGVIFEGYLAWLCDREGYFWGLFGVVGRPRGSPLRENFGGDFSHSQAVSRAFTLLFRVSG